MKIIVGFFAALAVMALPTIAAALNSSATPADSDVTTTNLPAAMSSSMPSTGIDEVLPIIETHDIPLPEAIDHLARQASINYLIAPQLEQKWSEFEEPPVSFRLTNAVARDVLVQMLNLRHIALVEDPASNIAFIIPADEITNPLFAGLPTNSAALHTNLIPLIQFSDVPITTAIENLARQEGVNYILTPKVSRQWDGAAPNGPEPLTTLRSANVTCWSALNRMLNIRGLVLVEDPATRVARVAFRGAALPIVDMDLLDVEGDGSNSSANIIIPLIQFSDVPLDTALENLSRQCELHVVLDPRLKDSSDPKTSPPMLTLRWENLTAKQALVALCENYDLIVTKNDSTGIIQITPGKVKKRSTP